MNKKILLGIAALAIAGVSVVNVNFNSRSNKLSGVSLANVEALATPEGNANTCFNKNMKYLFSLLLVLLSIVFVSAQQPHSNSNIRVVSTPRGVKPTEAMISPSSPIYKYWSPYVSEKVMLVIQIDEYRNGKLVSKNTDSNNMVNIEKGQRSAFEIIPEQRNDTMLLIVFNFPSVSMYKYRINQLGNHFQWKKIEEKSEEKLNVLIPLMVVYEDTKDEKKKKILNSFSSEEVLMTKYLKNLNMLKGYYIISYLLSKKI